MSGAENWSEAPAAENWRGCRARKTRCLLVQPHALAILQLFGEESRPRKARGHPVQLRARAILQPRPSLFCDAGVAVPAAGVR